MTTYLDSSIVAQRFTEVNAYNTIVAPVKHKIPLWNKGILCLTH